MVESVYAGADLRAAEQSDISTTWQCSLGRLDDQNTCCYAWWIESSNAIRDESFLSISIGLTSVVRMSVILIESLTRTELTRLAKHRF